jgi:hypothetical protein
MEPLWLVVVERLLFLLLEEVVVVDTTVKVEEVPVVWSILT